MNFIYSRMADGGKNPAGSYLQPCAAPAKRARSGTGRTDGWIRSDDAPAEGDLWQWSANTFSMESFMVNPNRSDSVLIFHKDVDSTLTHSGRIY